MPITLTPQTTLPTDAGSATLAGRVWRPDVAGPAVVTLRGGELVDVSRTFPTMRDLCEEADPAAALKAATGESLGPLAAILANTPVDARDATKPWLLSPLDLQAVKAAGVTFAVSMLERVIEEKARGNPAAAATIRTEIGKLIGDDLSKLKPGSPEAMHLKDVLIKQGAWSQYLEVGIGPDAEIFTKAPPMSSVGTGFDAGLHPASTWNNPEPEVVLLADATGTAVGAMLGNDVNLRDFEGRSALLLSKAKDNNASCALGPLVRLFDDAFTMDDVRRAEVSLRIEGVDGYVLTGVSTMADISRDPEDLLRQTMSEHQYPDGFALFLGTLFAPTQDRDAPNRGFTHKTGDLVTISSARLGSLTNRVTTSKAAPPWSFGIADLMANLAARGLLVQRESVVA